MFFRFSYGDIEAKILRPKVGLLAARYFFGIYFLSLCLLYKSLIGSIFLTSIIILYLVWTVIKNYIYVRNVKAMFYLPLIQLLSDIAVLLGVFLGFCKLVLDINLLKFITKNKFLLFILFCYLLIIFSTFKWGSPNVNHPFPYHMDEWHQLQAVRATFAYGTPNIAGSANGTMLHFFISGIFLVPFTIVGWIDPFVIKVSDFVNRARIFDLLRLNTAVFGLLAIIMLHKTSKLINASSKISIGLFGFTPIWLLLSGYFKYDIALIFWIITAFYFIARFIKYPHGRNFIIASIPIAFAVSTKISALPIVAVYFSSFFMARNKKINLMYLLAGILLSMFLIFIVGMPDVLFGKGNMYNYLWDNLIIGPSRTSEIDFGINSYVYLLTKHYPLIFGYGLVFLFIFSLIIFFGAFLKRNIFKMREKVRFALLLLFSFFAFFLSAFPLGFYSGGNRSLVLLPFAVLFVSWVYVNIASKSSFKNIAVFLFISVIIAQVIQSGIWFSVKYSPIPQERASAWIIENINKNKTIGIENIPIYQFLPDLVQKEFYYKQDEVGQGNKYNYLIINDYSTDLPEYIILTNEEIEDKILEDSPKKRLLKRILEEGYREQIVFSPNLFYLSKISDLADYYHAGLLVATPLTISIFKK